MIMEILCFVLIIELLINLAYFKWDFVHPAVIFNLMFVLASLDLFLMSDYWNVVVRTETIFIITLGILVFFVFAVIAQKIRIRNKFITCQYDVKSDISISRFWIYTVIYLTTLVMTVFYRIKSVGLSYAIGNIMTQYSNAVSLDELTNLPVFLKIMGLLCVSMAFVYAYLFVDYWAKNKKINHKLFFLLVISSIYLLICQKRGTFVMFMIFLFAQLLLQTKRFRAKKINRKIYIYVTASATVLLLSFNSIASLMGRTFGEDNPFALLSVYLGGPILNLNAVLNNMPEPYTTLPLSETFHGLYTAIYKYTGVKQFNYSTSNFFRSAAGHATGNVYTTFYDFYHDAGIVGVIILTAVMSFVACRIYRKIKTNNYKNILFYSVLYGYIFVLVWRSFFANSFYEWIQFSTLEMLLIWLIASYTLSGKVNLKKARIIIRR